MVFYFSLIEYIYYKIKVKGCFWFVFNWKWVVFLFILVILEKIFYCREGGFYF